MNRTDTARMVDGNDEVAPPEVSWCKVDVDVE